MDIPSSSFLAVGKSLIAVSVPAPVPTLVPVPVPAPIIISEEITVSDILFDWARNLVEYFGEY